MTAPHCNQCKDMEWVVSNGKPYPCDHVLKNFSFLPSEVNVLTSEYGTFWWEPKTGTITYSPTNTSKRYVVFIMKRKVNSHAGALKRSAKLICSDPRFQKEWDTESDLAHLFRSTDD